MRPTLLAVRSAVGNPTLTSIKRNDKYGVSTFDVFDVDLPLPDFSGVPGEWLFCVQNAPISEETGLSREKLIEDADSTIHAIPKTALVVLLSDDAAAHLGDEFNNIQRDVFCLDALELPRQQGVRTLPKLAPFVLAVRRKLERDPLSLAFSPYQRNKPVSGWQFFGRRRELEQVVRRNENYVIVGARRVGKTSLMQEAARRLKEDGQTVYYVDVQNCRSPSDVISEIVRLLSPRDLAAAVRRHHALNDQLLSSVLRRIVSNDTPTTLFLDELGNVITDLRKEDWGFLGVLRKYASQGKFKFVMSCFQEVFLRQQKEFSGPLINVAHTMRLDPFRRGEVEEVVTAPLEFWKTLDDRQKRMLVDLVMSTVGCHPYLLQHFCYALFEHVAAIPDCDPVSEARALMHKHLDDWASSAVDEIFFRIPSSLQKLLFLKRCKEAEEANTHLLQAEITESWVDTTLQSIGYASTLPGRLNLLEGLEIHTLCSAGDNDRLRKQVCAPLIYHYVKHRVQDVDAFLDRLATDVRREAAVWELNEMHARH
jgi:AAA domain